MSIKRLLDEGVIKIAKEIHQRIRRHRNNVPDQTREARQITLEWQKECITRLGNHFLEEVRVDNHSKEKIDLLDTKKKIAYEMKVSGNNAHHEFYKDVMKVIMYNENHKGDEIRKLVFLSEENGISNLKTRINYGKDSKFLNMLKVKHCIDIELVVIP